MYGEDGLIRIDRGGGGEGRSRGERIVRVQERGKVGRVDILELLVNGHQG